MRISVRRRWRGDSGAAAVEFALVLPLLLLLMVGIIQYGLFFNNYLQARQAARQAARTASVETFNACAGATTNAAEVQCYAKSITSPVTGDVAVHVEAHDGWGTGKPVIVCETVKTVDITGMIPMPNDGFVFAKTQMSIEQELPAPTPTPPAMFISTDADPTGQNWNWCS